MSDHVEQEGSLVQGRDPPGWAAASPAVGCPYPPPAPLNPFLPLKGKPGQPLTASSVRVREVLRNTLTCGSGCGGPSSTRA